MTRSRSLAIRLMGLAGLVAGLGLGCGTPVQVVELSLVCQPQTTLPNGVSFIFKAQTGYTDQPVTNLLTTTATVEDNAPNYENVQYLLQHPEQLSLRTLILLDASGSLWTADGSIQNQIKTAVIQFVEQIYQVNDRNMIGVYMFSGENNPILMDVYPFSAAREEALSPATYANDPPSQQQSDLQAAWDNDRQMLEQAVMTNYVIQEYATTALFDATLAALQTIQQPPSGPSGPVMAPQALSADTLILFTDGNDEVYTGEGMGSQRSMVEANVLQQAGAFRMSGNNTILVAGVTGGGGDQLDTTFLDELASPGGVLTEDLSQLPQVFSGVAQQAVAEVQEYYQFNMCSPRRKTPVQAQLILTYPNGTATALTFNYDATNFVDPTPQDPCDVTQLPTCTVAGN